MGDSPPQGEELRAGRLEAQYLYELERECRALLAPEGEYRGGEPLGRRR